MQGHTSILLKQSPFLESENTNSEDIGVVLLKNVTLDILEHPTDPDLLTCFPPIFEGVTYLKN